MRIDTEEQLSQTRPRVLVADDHQMVAEGISHLLSGGYDLLGVVHDGRTLLARLEEERPDIVLSDVSMPDMSGIEAMKAANAKGLQSAFIFMTIHREPALVREAMELGARGYVLKASAGEELLRALKDVMEGRIYVSSELWPAIVGKSSTPVLTAKQNRVLSLLSQGLRSKEIADRLHMSVRTVDSHRYTIMKALNVHSSVALIREAERLGLVKT